MRGDGRVFQRGNRWWVSYYLNGTNFRHPGGSTEAEARKTLKAKMWEAAGGQHVSPQEERVTVKELLDALERHLTMKGAKAMVSFKAHKKAVKAAFGHFRAAGLRNEDIERFQSDQPAEKVIGDKKKPGKAPATVNRYIETLRSAFNLAKKQGRLTRTRTSQC